MVKFDKYFILFKFSLTLLDNIELHLFFLVYFDSK